MPFSCKYAHVFNLHIRLSLTTKKQIIFKKIIHKIKFSCIIEFFLSIPNMCIML